VALSDYLTSDEWDACLYAFIGQHKADNFGDSMHLTIDTLLESGYEFEGLDAQGQKKCSLGGVNAPKALIWFGNPEGIDVIDLLDNGRNFLKEHMPSLVDETDEDWGHQKDTAGK